MRERSNPTIVIQGSQYRIGCSGDDGIIWRRRLWGWRPIAHYPLTADGWRVAAEQFAKWEPGVGSVAATYPPWGGIDPNTHSQHPATRRHGVLPWVVGGIALLLVVAGVVAWVVSTMQTTPGTRTAAAFPAEHQPATLHTVERSPIGNGFLALSNGSLAFIQWSDADGSLSGTAQVISTSGQAPNESVGSNTISVTGTLSDSSITLSFDGGPQVFGKLSGSSFTVDFPQSDGSLAPVTFHAASAGAFNRALHHLQQEVATVNSNVAQAQAAARRIRQQQAAISAAAQTVQSDIEAMGQAGTSMQADVQGVGGDVNGVNQDLQTVQSDEQQVATDVQQQDDEACGDASGTAGDASGVAGDASGVEGDAGTVEQDVTQLRSAITGLQSDYQTYVAATRQLPSYQVADAPSQAAVTQAVSAANAAIDSAVSTVNGYIDQANADVAAAYQDAANAYQTGGCGPAPSAPEPQPHIS